MFNGKKRFILIATSFSEPGTMGGNTKIAIEMVRYLSERMPVVVIIPATRLPTLTGNLALNDGITVITTEIYKRNPRLHPFDETRFYHRQLKKLFSDLNVSSSDLVFTSSDFLYDALPMVILKKTFHFTWITSTFLFVPPPWENLIKRYKFPFFLYILVYIYQRSMFRLIKWRGDLFVVTSECDRKYFSAKHQRRFFAIYGGVNIEQIEAVEREPATVKYDLIYCSRLHPQKGLHQFLDVWKHVVQKQPDAKLAVIGNGAPDYEHYLHKKAERLGIAQNIEWLGYVNNKEKYRLYRSSRFFVHPTVYDTNGMVAMEALCMGTWAIINDLPDLRDLYTDGCTKCDFSDHAATASVIDEMLRNPASYEMPRDLVLKLRKHWAWENRMRLFERFLCAAEPIDNPIKKKRAQ